MVVEKVRARQKRHLLLDSRIVDKTENVRLTVGMVKKHPANPLLVADKPWEIAFGNMYPSIIYDETDELYKCWYNSWVIDKAHETTPLNQRHTKLYKPTLRALTKPGEHSRVTGLCYAESQDGLHWTKPMMDICLWRDQKSNLLIVGPSGVGIFRDTHDPDPERRYKMIAKDPYNPELRMSVSFSPDGLRWPKPVGCLNVKADTHNNGFWCPELNRYVVITRQREEEERLVVRTESDDFMNWSLPEIVLRGSCAHKQTYSMPVLRYAGIYMGLPAIFNTETDRVHTELAWSPDTIHWHRIDEDTSFVPNSDTEGDYDWGCVYLADDPVILDDEIRLYYMGDQGRHSNWRGPKMGLCLATLRPDGFAGYQTVEPNQVGTVYTQPFIFSGSALRLSADAVGSVKVTILDQNGETLIGCRQVTGELSDALVVAESESDLSFLKGRSIRLKFELNRAILYSFTLGDLGDR
jgi:hypothetical protein